jgi:O-antigen ligase
MSRTRRLATPLAIAGLLLATAGLLWWLQSPVVLLLPATLLAVPVLARRFFSEDPIPVLVLFLLAIVHLDFFKVGGTGISLDVLLSAILVWALLLRIMATGMRLGHHPVERFYLLFLGVMLASVLLSVAPAQSFKRWGRELEYLVLFSFLVSYPLTAGEKRGLAAAVVASSFLVCVLGIAGYVLAYPPFLGKSAYLGAGRGYVLRTSATLSHPVTLSLYLAFVAVLTFSFLVSGRTFRRKWLAPLFALQVLTLYLTFGRSGWGAFVIGIAALLWIRRQRRFLFLGVPFLFYVLWKAVPTLQERWATATAVGEENSLLWRLGLWAHALRIFPKRPVFGSGPGTFIEYVAYQTGYAPHQTWIGLLVETGILGLAAFVALTLVVGWHLRRRLREAGPRRDPLLEGTTAAWVGLLAASLTANVFSLPSVIVYLWVSLALALRRDRSVVGAAEGHPAGAALTA